MMLTLGKLAEQIGGELQKGDPECEITAVATLQNAGTGDISFLSNPGYKKYLCKTQASAVILSPENSADCPTAVIASSNPYVSYARAAALIVPAPPPKQGIHPGATVEDDCEIDASAWIGPGCIIEQGVVINASVQLDGGCFVGADSVIGAHSHLHANVVICHGVSIGMRVNIFPGAVIGGDGFGLANDDGKWVNVPQLGTVVVGDDVEIGSNTTIDRGALEDTVLEEGVRLDNQIQVAHNVHIGAHTAIAGCTGISGSATIGKYCMIGGGVGIVGHLEIADHVVVTGMSLVARSITEPGVYSSGVPAQDNVSWNRNYARLRQLDKLARRVLSLERRSSGDKKQDNG
ncbi:MAG: UDP-3-O-(3-hydroxymyristoyl)glucosamine N-acyltransferase [Gammaproteobacteria bacterium]|nr:MAG: UDP-3-O-(3-hydroxymyristoyl)glucosamine N-acyltransferase [Gammaproteobacteria bacterium]